MTPPGSGCSITIGKGLDRVEAGLAPGPPALRRDIEAAHAELAGARRRRHADPPYGTGGWQDGKGGDWNSFFFFKDPDGNGWAVQESPTMRAQLEASTAATTA